MQPTMIAIGILATLLVIIMTIGFLGQTETRAERDARTFLQAVAQDHR